MRCTAATLIVFTLHALGLRLIRFDAKKKIASKQNARDQSTYGEYNASDNEYFLDHSTLKITDRNFHGFNKHFDKKSDNNKIDAVLSRNISHIVLRMCGRA